MPVLTVSMSDFRADYPAAGGEGFPGEIDIRMTDALQDLTADWTLAGSYTCRDNRCIDRVEGREWKLHTESIMGKTGSGSTVPGIAQA